MPATPNNNGLKGRRVRLVSCSDEYTRLERGAEGTVRMVDSVGTVHVAWDSGAMLGLILGKDQFYVLPEEV